jgi:hypothetical protein
MQHYPHPLILIQTDFNKMIASAKRTQMVVVISIEKSRIFGGELLKSRQQLLPVLVNH